jgi:phage terminase large subunit-like protein
MGVATKSTFGNKPIGGSCKERHHQKPWFDTDCCIAKRELKLWLKANPNLHTTKHQKNKLKSLLKRKKIIWETTRAQHMHALTKVDALSF